MKNKILSLSALATAVLLAACAPIPKLAEPAKPIAAEQAGLHAGTSAELSAEWWTAFKDPQLNALIERALAESPSLAAARARVARANAGIEGARAKDMPVVGAELDIQRTLLTENYIYPPPLGGSVITTGNLQAGISYDWDFFGKHKAELNAALGSARAAQADAAAARLMLSAQVARAYLTLGRVLAQQELLKSQLADREQAVALVRERTRAGLDNTADLRGAEAPVPELRRQAVSLGEQAGLLRNQLAALSAQPMDAVASLSPRLPDSIALTSQNALTLDLLGRRPDVVAARWRVEAAAQQVKVNRAQFYPDLTLSAFVGFNAIGLDKLLNSGSQQWGFGPSLRLPLFDTGALTAQLKGSAAEADAAVASYNGAVFEAVRDASDQLTTLQSLQGQQAEQQIALSTAESAYKLAEQRYAAGIGNRLPVLAAHGNVLSQQRQALDLRGLQLESQVGLMRSLGGGWTDTAAR